MGEFYLVIYSDFSNSREESPWSLPDALRPLALPRKCLHLASTQADVLATRVVVGKTIATG
jgi:hypothetical protein